jgi:hypothetical protein
MAGYSGTPLPKKLGLKEGQRIAIINEPPNFLRDLGALPANTQRVKRLSAPLDLVLLFVDHEKTLSIQFSSLAKKLSNNGMIWVAWPKKSSGVPTDLTFERVQRIGLKCCLVDVKICAVNDVWSGLKFVIRLKDRKSSK